MTDTIFALSSGSLPSGLAVLRISGPQSRVVVETMCGNNKFGNPVFLSRISDPTSNEVLDKGLVLTFVGPNSFTGEDVVELHVHGGVGVIDAVLGSLADLKGFRAAEAGEFTYRAFVNGKVDLTQAEGIADLIDSESEAQRKLALGSVEGKAFETVNLWSDRLLRMRALIEAEIDFVDEDDIPGSVSDQVWAQAGELVEEMDSYLDAGKNGEIVRDGFHVALLGRPNAGKSTLLNYLAKREVAIVSDIPGTTRDVLEVKLNLGGHIVYVSDTAGIRSSQNEIEKEGIRRARDVAKQSDLTVWLHAADDKDNLGRLDINADITILTKNDLGDDNVFVFDIEISVFENKGVDRLVKQIEMAATKVSGAGNKMMFSRKRQQGHLRAARESIACAILNEDEPLEVRAEGLRIAASALGKIAGLRDNEDILGTIFSEFCVGK